MSTPACVATQGKAVAAEITEANAIALRILETLNVYDYEKMRSRKKEL